MTLYFNRHGNFHLNMLTSGVADYDVCHINISDMHPLIKIFFSWLSFHSFFS